MQGQSRLIILFFFSAVVNLLSYQAWAQGTRFGAYYFDGWSGKTFHLSKKLVNDYPERKPINGWITSSQASVDLQIQQAAEAGLSFFNFCWYFDGKDINEMTTDVRNNALNYYLKSSHKSSLGFSLMVANHKGYVIKKEHWDLLTDYWCNLFSEQTYVKVDGCPLITFFDIYSLVKTFGHSSYVNEAIRKFKAKAKSKGFKGIRVAICVTPTNDQISLAARCGFDIVTAYNYHAYGLNGANEVLPIGAMKKGDVNSWDKMLKLSKLPIIPTVTLNWDRRAWDTSKVKVSKRFSGYSQNSVKNSILYSREWLARNNSRSVNPPIVMLYAWNEYGEGAWLTPSEKLKDSLLTGLEEGIKKNK